MNVRRINVRSFDFDGCIFNKAYTESVTENYSVIRGDDVFDEQLINHNQDFIEAISREINENRFDEVITMVGSNRQSFRTDRKNVIYDDGVHEVKRKGSCFPALVKLTEELSRLTNDICRYDGYLLADTYDNLKHGANFQAALLDESIEPESGHYSQWLFDESKFTIFYAQMHKIASENPEAEIVFDIYDDNEKILAALHRRFKQTMDLIPANLKLRLHVYAGNNINDYEMLQGRGEIDYNFESNIFLMIQMAGLRFPEDTNDEHNVLQKVFDNGILHFIKERETTLPKEVVVDKVVVEPVPIASPVKKPSPVVREPVVLSQRNPSIWYRYRWLIAAVLILLGSLSLAALIVSLAFVPVAPIFTFAFGLGLALKVTASSALGAGLAVLGSSIAAGTVALGLSAFAVWDRVINKKNEMVEVTLTIPDKKEESVRPVEGFLSGSTGSIMEDLGIELDEIHAPESVSPEPGEVMQPVIDEESLVKEPDNQPGLEKKSSSDDMSRSQHDEEETGHSSSSRKNGKKKNGKNGKKENGKKESIYAGDMTQFPGDESHERKGISRKGTLNQWGAKLKGSVKEKVNKLEERSQSQSKKLERRFSATK